MAISNTQSTAMRIGPPIPPRRVQSAPTRRRRALVQPLLAAYAAVPDVAAAAVSGSVARGAADRWSDVEMMVFWSRPPGDQERRQSAQRARAEDRPFFPIDADDRDWRDDISAGGEGLRVEVTHAIAATADEQLNRLLEVCEPDHPLLNLDQGIIDAVPAHGSTL